MSLFKAREWWGTGLGEDDGFDQASICVSNLGSGDDDKDLIVVGSHSGIIRVFSPTLPPAAEAPGYKAKDLLIETHLAHPILQLQVGRFISGSPHLHLAVLHPRSMAVHSLVVRAGNTEHGEQSALIFVYEHQLKRSAYSLVAGPFGGVRGRDFICVQALDGNLCFFEQETFVFTRQLPNFLLPGPLIFVASTDSFVTCNSHYCVESYKYQVLAEAEDNRNKVLPAEWSLNIGESALDIIDVSHSATEVDILVLGEHNLFCVRDHGTLKFMRRFEFNPRCFHAYCTVPEGLIMVLVATDTGTLLVLNNATLRWSAQLPFTPVALCRASLSEMEGVLVLLSDIGALRCCYMGTEPSLFVAPSVEPRPIDYQEAERELHELSKTIRAFSDSSHMLMANTAAEQELKVTVTPSEHPETRSEGDHQVCHVTVDLVPHSAQAPLTKVQVTIVPHPPLVADPPVHSITSLGESYQVASYIMIPGLERDAIQSLEVSVIVSYMTGADIPRLLYSSCSLPLKLAATPCVPAKDAELKLTLNTNLPVISLLELFPEFNTKGAGANVMAFSLGPSVVTLMAAKSTTRYRIQSDSIVPMAIIIKQLVNRLDQQARSKDKQATLKMTLSSQPPLQQLFAEIENHFECRKKVSNLKEEIGQLSVQFRAIERRLLAKMKDKKPSPLNGLDTLLYTTKDEIINTSHALESAIQKLESAQCRTGCAVDLIQQLVFMSDVSSRHAAAFQAAMSSHVSDAEDQGWEDMTNAGLQFLLQSLFISSKKEETHRPTLGYEPVTDINVLKRKITAALEFLISDSHENSPTQQEGRKTISPIEESVETEEEPSVPLGSRLAQNRAVPAAGPRSRLLPEQLSLQQAGNVPNSDLADVKKEPGSNEEDVVWI